MSEEKKKEKKISWLADVGGEKIEKENCRIKQLFSMKSAFLREKRTGKWSLFQHVGGKNKKKAEMATFFSRRTQFKLIEGSSYIEYSAGGLKRNNWINEE